MEVDTDYDSLDEGHVDEDGFNYDRFGDRFVYHVQVRFHTFPRLMGGVEDDCIVWLSVVRVYYTTGLLCTSEAADEGKRVDT